MRRTAPIFLYCGAIVAALLLAQLAQERRRATEELHGGPVIGVPLDAAAEITGRLGSRRVPALEEAAADESRRESEEEPRTIAGAEVGAGATETDE